MKNSGFFSSQSILIVLGITIPFMTNIITSFSLLDIPPYTTAITFTFSILCFFLAIFKYDFLNVVPIALQKIVDHISDSFVVIDENYNIIDFNKTFHKNFKELIKIKRSVNLFNEIANNTNAGIDKDAFADIIKRCKQEKKTITLEQTIHYPNYKKTFNIDITPIFNHDRNVGTIILFKDITAINNAHKQLIEQEKFSSLGQLIGGIAHDMNSRLYALDGQIYLVEKFANEIKNNETLDRQDYISIAEDILKQIENMKLAESSMSKTIDSVRNHTRNYASDNNSEFGMYKVIETIDTLLGQKFQRHNCKMIYKQNKKEDILIRGDFSKFESVLINIISNAVEAYNMNGEKKGGLVEIYAEEKDNEIIISVKDYGKGIPEIIRNDIFKEVLTTKGVNGTGMGLYFSRSIIVGSFKGDIWFETENGKGTKFYVKVPRE